MIFKVVGDFSPEELSSILFGRTIIGETPIQNCKLIRCGVSIPFEELGLENFTVSDAREFQIMSLSEMIDYASNHDCYMMNDMKIPIDGLLMDTNQALPGYILVEKYPFRDKVVYIYRRIDFYGY